MNFIQENVKLVIITVIAAILALMFWPFRTVPTGSRGVITQFGAIRGAESSEFTTKHL